MTSKTQARPGGIQLSEADIARTCSDFLIADGWRMLITDPVSDKSQGKGFGELGMADRLYIRYGQWMVMFPDSVNGLKTRSLCETQTLWIEWKRVVRGRPTKPTGKQEDWHMAERSRGALTLIAGVDFGSDAKTGQEMTQAFIDWYKASGLQRR